MFDRDQIDCMVYLLNIISLFFSMTGLFFICNAHKYEAALTESVGIKCISGSLPNLSPGRESARTCSTGSQRAPSMYKPNTSTPSVGGDGP